MKRLVALLILTALLFSLSCKSRKEAPYIIPLANASNDVQEGKLLFNNFCNKCHPDGTAGLGPSIINKPFPDFLIRFQIRNGLGVMPAFKKDYLPDEDVKKIISYINALQEAGN